MYKRILNEAQRSNLSLLDPITVERLKKSGDYRDSPSALLRCVCCGSYRITTPIIQFFGYRGDKLKCYSCQKLITVKNI